MTKSKTSSILEDLELIEKGLLLSTQSSEEDDLFDDWDDEPEKKRKRKRNKRKPKKAEPKKTEETKTDIRKNLLAEWEEDSENDEFNFNSSNLNLTGSSESTIEESKPKGTPEGLAKKEGDKSCFDFDEEDESHEIINTSGSRKIPRVIPDKPKPIESDLDNDTSVKEVDKESVEKIDENKPDETISKEPSKEAVINIISDFTAEDESNKSPTPEKAVEELKTTTAEEPKSTTIEEPKIPTEEEKGNNNTPEPEDNAFKDLLDSTSVPELPEIPSSVKFEQNFHNSKTIKFPDKENSDDSATKLETDKLIITEPRSPIKVSEIHLPKFDLPVEEKPVSKPEVKEPETPSKLINPKKRFVKSFEDFEQQLNSEQRKIIEEVSLEPDKNMGKMEFSKLKSQVMAKLESSDGSNTETPKKTKTHKSRFSATPKSNQSNDNFLPTPKINLRTRSSKTPSSESKPHVETKKSPVREVVKAKKKLIDDEDSSEPSSDKEKKEFQEQLNKKIKVLIKSPDRKESTKIEDVQSSPGKIETSNDDEPRISLKELAIEKAIINDEEIPLENLMNLRTETIIEDQIKQPEDLLPALIKQDCLQENTQIEISSNDQVVIETQTENVEVPLPIEQPSEERNDTSTVHISDTLSNVDSNFEANNPEVAAPNVSFSCTNTESKDSEDLSALTTLATISELSTNLDIHGSSSKTTKLVQDNLANLENTDNINIIDKANLTFVTEADLADGQVEIADSSVSKEKSKPITLSNFSVDFSDTNKSVPEEIITTSTEPVVAIKKRKYIDNDPTDSIERSLGKVFEEDPTPTTKDADAKSPNKRTSGDIEEQIPSLLIYSDQKKPKSTAEYTSSSKLLEILTDGKQHQSTPEPILSPIKTTTPVKSNTKVQNFALKSVSKPEPKTKFLIKQGSGSLKSIPSKSFKPVTLSEKFVKHPESAESISVQKVTSKRTNQDIEDIDTFIIQKPTKKLMVSQEIEQEDAKIIRKPVVARGKAKILQQTIIKPAGDIIQPPTSTIVHSNDDNMFDINSMPIVLGDQILTAESIENMPVVLSEHGTQLTPIKTIVSTPTTVSKPTDQIKLLNKSSPTMQSMYVKSYSQNLTKGARIYQTASTKLMKTNPAIITKPGKPDKFIIVPPTSSAPTGSKYTVGKRTPVVKRTTSAMLPTSKVQTQTSEPSGNKIMIVTDQEGKQSRLLLTPAHQKLLGYQTQGTKLVKSTIKSNILQKTPNVKSTIISPATVASSVPGMIVKSKNELITTNQNVITSDGQILMSVKGQHQLKNLKVGDTIKPNRKIQLQPQKMVVQERLKTTPVQGQQKTIVIKNQQGQIVKKIQGTDDAFLEQQVAEQVQAIKASGSFSSIKGRQELVVNKMKPPIKRSYPKKPTLLETGAKKPTPITYGVASKVAKTEAIPPLAPISSISPISPKKQESVVVTQKQEEKVDPTKQTKEGGQQKPLNQLIIQDALGNQTTITEGQILALPSGETVDGQPQSYMLVTLDESGNLAPLNNEALLSLDPNLCLGGDLSNMVLQIDDGSAKKDSVEAPATVKVETPVVEEKPIETPPEQIEYKPPEKVEESKPLSVMENPSQENMEAVQTVTCSIGNDPNQQLIITGDPISTQKFIESLTEGNPDLANLLANAEGNILIQTDEQQILINTDADNQVLLPMNNEGLGVIQNSEGDGNPIFATQPSKNQDILAAALADTDVFQPEHATSPALSKVSHSQLSPNSGLYPSGVANVLGTTLSLSSPIMTPLEVPSSNSKKIPDEESDILTTEVPKNVDLPITITDPNISQTVAQQQVASLIASELTTSLDLPLTIQDQGVPLTSSEMNSPSFVYSLPSLPSLDSVDIHPKTFNEPISMPLLTEDPQETSSSSTEKTDLTETTIQEKEITSTPCDVDINSASNSNLQLNSPSVEETNSLFESDKDSIKETEKMHTSANFLGTTIESDEGLCTLGGAMCSSLSEPPPDMFDLSVVGGTYTPESVIKENVNTETNETDVVEKPTVESEELKDQSNSNETNTNNDYDKFENFDAESRNDDTPLSTVPLNSESSSPAVNIDENSCEIPVQPQIVTDLSSSSFEANETTDSADFDSNKRLAEDAIETDKKKIKFD